jgi:hypothetical protein
MPGGLLQLVAHGQSNLLLTGNPKTTFFKAVYKHYTPFGLQRFRIDYEGDRNLSFDAGVEMEFKIPRYAEMLWDTYVVVNLPDIWSPLFFRQHLVVSDKNPCYLPYEFKWTTDIGFAMIDQVTIYSGGQTLAQYSGEWMMNAIRRDDQDKKELLGRMTGGDVDRLTNPEKYWGHYPNAVPSNSYNTSGGVEPSIRGRQLYIPLMAWFCYSTKTALPLIALQYQEVHIKIRFKPVKDLFTILDVEQLFTPPLEPMKMVSQLKRKAPNTSNITDQMWKFIQQPPKLPTTDQENHSIYGNRRNDWNADIHLIGTYIFLGDNERRKMAEKCHETLIKEQYEWDYLNITGSRRVDIPSKDMVSSYMWRFRRSDVNLRNQWFNYSNFEWEGIPSQYPSITDLKSPTLGQFVVPDNPLGLYSTGPRTIGNEQNILIDMAILCGQDYRENLLPAGVYAYIEKLYRTTGVAKYGLYCYNFCTNSSRFIYQPTGAQNTNKWKYITFEFNTIQPPKNTDDETNGVDIMCDDQGNIIGVRKDVWRLNEYNYDLRVFEERYNMIEIQGGRIGLLIAR